MLVADDFFNYAKDLVKENHLPNHEELSIKTAINRVHYGMFHKVIALYHIEFKSKKEKETCHKIVRDIIDMW